VGLACFALPLAFFFKARRNMGDMNVEESIVAEGLEQLASQLQPFRTAPFQLPSSLARSLGAIHNQTIHADLLILGALVDIVDPMSQALHVESEKHMPRIAAFNGGLDSTYARITGVQRKETCAWMLCTTFNMQLPDELFFTTVMQLDRFYAAKHRGRTLSSSPDTLPTPDAATVVQLRSLASINLVLKTHGTGDHQSRRSVIAQLSRGFCRVEQVYKAELLLLNGLDYNTTVPSSLDFLIVLSNTLQGTLSGYITCLSNFLLHLSLGEADVHYKYPHAVLSVAALSLAFWVFGSPSALYKQVFDDLLIIMFPSSGTTEERGADPLAPPEASQSMERSICEDITRCAWELHQLWWRHSSSSKSCVYAAHLRQKFLAPQTHFVASLVPPQLPLPSFPPNTQRASEYTSYVQGWFAIQRQVGAMPLGAPGGA